MGMGVHVAEKNYFFVSQIGGPKNVWAMFDQRPPQQRELVIK
jgi:hypothetical protein